MLQLLRLLQHRHIRLRQQIKVSHACGLDLEEAGLVKAPALDNTRIRMKLLRAGPVCLLELRLAG